MRIISETSLENFDAWCGARDTLNTLIENGVCDDLENILEEEYPDGLTETQLNDILWFEPEWCYHVTGILDSDYEGEE